MTEPTDTRVPLTLCWHCDRTLDAAMSTDEVDAPVPEPGAVSLCVYCGAVGVFGEDLRLEKPTEAMLDELGEDREFRGLYTAFMWSRQRLMLRVSLLGYEAEREDGNGAGES